MSDIEDVAAAGTELIAAFAASDRPRYFACFEPHATFIFPNEKEVLKSRGAYEAAWDSWVRDFGFAVIDCKSSNQHVAVYGDVGVFTHQTVTQIVTTDGEQTLHERETIIFHRTGGKWLAVHEHLSPLPG
jgi:ketosteroid isomerase-like protein